MRGLRFRLMRLRFLILSSCRFIFLRVVVNRGLLKLAVGVSGGRKLLNLRFILSVFMSRLLCHRIALSIVVIRVSGISAGCFVMWVRRKLVVI